MKRTNIFEILEEKNKNAMGSNVERIYELYDKYSFCNDGLVDYTLREFLDLYSFDNWKNKNHCISVDDFMKTINFDLIICGATSDLNDFLTFIEVIYNFYYISKNYIECSAYNFKFDIGMYKLKDLMDICLSDYNYLAFYNKEREQLIIVEDNPEAVAVAENLEPEIAFDVIRYNHNTLKGDIKTKKHILTIMASELEPKKTN